MRWRRWAPIAATLAVLSSCAPVAQAHSSSGTRLPRHVPGVVLVGFRPGVSPAQRRALARSVAARGASPLGYVGTATPAARALRRRIGASFLLHVPRGSVPEAVRRLARAHPWVRYAEPDYVLGPTGAPRAPVADAIQPAGTSIPNCPSVTGPGVIPNDPGFGCQWGALNVGQTLTGASGTVTGTAGADEDLTRAWALTTGSRSIVIGEVDTGVDYNHPDLQANIWTNPGGIGGCPAGTHGYVTSYDNPNGTCNPMDDTAAPPTSYGGHGTHVAGIMGAVGDNGIGVAGVNWQTTILPVKTADYETWGSDSELIAGLAWLVKAKQAGVNIRVVNDSPVSSSTPDDPALANEISALGANNILFVTGAGGAVTPAGNNWSGVSDDTNPHYPCDFNLPNEICVTGSDQHDNLAHWADWGSDVALAAPGDNIYSTTLPNDGNDSSDGSPYGSISGVSMATAQVSGAAALILSAYDFPTYQALKADILDNVHTLPSLAGKVSTGGRLDVCGAIPGCAHPLSTQTAISCAPAAVTVGQATTCTATVSDGDPNSLVAPTGTVTFASNASGTFASGGSCTLAAGSSPGQGSCSIGYTPTAVGSGEHQLTAAYGGDAAHVSSSGSSTLAVGTAGGPLATQAVISCAPSPVRVGQPTTCTATVSDTDSTAVLAPTGAVRFASNASGTFASGGSCTLAAGSSPSEASCSIAYTPTKFGSGHQRITAAYGGDSDHSSSSGQFRLLLLHRGG
ncbi:MAG TPA: S8 family serine peptidase [Solirubrobacteraceae bacterium]|nr:S8 family serine peptidase [Solirubrobacteraceae bacterium]